MTNNNNSDFISLKFNLRMKIYIFIYNYIKLSCIIMQIDSMKFSFNFSFPFQFQCVYTTDPIGNEIDPYCNKIYPIGNVINSTNKKKMGLSGDWTRDLLHPKQESYH